MPENGGMENNMTLDQKEKDLLKDLKGQEKLCVDKYAKHASCAKDAQLKNLFTQISQNEQKHLDALTQIENGTVPQFSGTDLQQPTFTATYGATENPDKKNDCYLCSDLLATEKHASSLYDTCIFEFKDENLRQVLNSIQKQEQEHGKQLYDYMSTNNMYA